MRIPAMRRRFRANLLKRVESMDMHDQIFDVLVPTEEVMEIKDGQRRQGEQADLPRLHPRQHGDVG